VSAVQTRSVVLVAAVLAYSRPSWHTVNGAHRRSTKAVAVDTSYSAAVHDVCVVQVRSLVVVGAMLWNSLSVHARKATHMRSEVAEAATRSYSRPRTHVVSVLQVRSLNGPAGTTWACMGASEMTLVVSNAVR